MSLENDIVATKFLTVLVEVGHEPSEAFLMRSIIRGCDGPARDCITKNLGFLRYYVLVCTGLGSLLTVKVPGRHREKTEEWPQQKMIWEGFRVGRSRGRRRGWGVTLWSA